MKTKIIPKLALLLTGALTLARLAPGQTAVLYQQDFGSVNGGTSLAAVGWSQVLPTGGYSGIYAQPGAIDGTTAASLPTSTLYFGGGSGSGVFFTVNGAGSGTGGDSAFTSIDPTLYTNLNLSIETQWSYQGANLKNWFVVEVGGAWYIDTNTLITTAQTSASAVFYQSSITYNPAKTNWNVLTNTTIAAIGPQASANLSGTIDGIGIYAALSGSGSWNYNNYLITSISNPAVQVPIVTAGPISQSDYAGAGVSFAVAATGSAPLTYYWQENGLPLTNNSRSSGVNSPPRTSQTIGDSAAGLSTPFPPTPCTRKTSRSSAPMPSTIPWRSWAGPTTFRTARTVYLKSAAEQARSTPTKAGPPRPPFTPPPTSTLALPVCRSQ